MYSYSLHSPLNSVHSPVTNKFTVYPISSALNSCIPLSIASNIVFVSHASLWVSLVWQHRTCRCQRLSIFFLCRYCPADLLYNRLKPITTYLFIGTIPLAERLSTIEVWLAYKYYSFLTYAFSFSFLFDHKSKSNKFTLQRGVGRRRGSVKVLWGICYISPNMLVCILVVQN